MKAKEVKELREKDKEDLEKSLKKERDRLRQLRFQLAGGKLKNHKEISKIKSNIARMLTIIKEKQTEGKRK